MYLLIIYTKFRVEIISKLEANVRVQKGVSELPVTPLKHIHAYGDGHHDRSLQPQSSITCTRLGPQTGNHVGVA